jgi:Na+/melibiose symporter-like transporter
MMSKKCGEKMKRKIIVILGFVFILFMLGLFIYYFKKGDTSRWQVAIGGVIVCALPLILVILKNNPFNIYIIIGYYFFIFCTTYLGSIASFYLQYKWWDSTLHFYKGIFVGCTGIALFKAFIPEKARRGLSRSILFLFVLSLAVTASVLWEVYEFLGDQFFTHTMQRGGNKDTMLDLLYGMAGGILIAVYSSIKWQKV